MAVYGTRAGNGASHLLVPTLEEVAARAGVSRSTASRAINGGLRVSPEALASVERAVTELGYTPNRAARSLVTRRTDSIALVVPEPDERVLTDPFFAGVLSGVSASLADSDIQVVLVIARPGQSERTHSSVLTSNELSSWLFTSSAISLTFPLFTFPA